MEQGAISDLITDRMRSGLHEEAMTMMKELMLLEKGETQSGNNNMEQRGLLQLLNYLIVDYFNWNGFRNTMKTFEMEMGDKSRPKPREKLQQELNADLPVLLQMLLKETKQNNEPLLGQKMWANIPRKPVPDSKKLKKPSRGSHLSKSKKEEKKIVSIEKESLNESSNKQTEIPTRIPSSGEKSRHKPNKTSKENLAKKFKTRAKNVQVFENVVQNFPALKNEIRKKTMNKKSTQTMPDATAQAILDIVGTLQRSKAPPKKSSAKLRGPKAPAASIKETPNKQAPIKVENSPKDSPAVTGQVSAKTVPRDPVSLKDSRIRPKKKGNVRRRMVESHISGARAY